MKNEAKCYSRIRYVPDYEIDITVARVIRYLIASSLLCPRIKSQSLARERGEEGGKRKKGIKRLELCQLLATLNRFLIDRWNEPSKSDPLAAIRREKPLFSFFSPPYKRSQCSSSSDDKYELQVQKLNRKFYYSHSTKKERKKERNFLQSESLWIQINKYASEY